MGPLKIISDGSLNTRTAWCEHAYADGSGHGAPNQTPAELRALMSARDRHGLRDRRARDRRRGLPRRRWRRTPRRARAVRSSTRS